MGRVYLDQLSLGMFRWPLRALTALSAGTTGAIEDAQTQFLRRERELVACASRLRPKTRLNTPIAPVVRGAPLQNYNNGKTTATNQ